MMRRFMTTLGVVAVVGLAVGCGGSSGGTAGGAKPSGEKGTVDKLKEGAGAVADKAGGAAKEAGDKAKELLTKGKEELLKQLGLTDMKMLEDKVNGLTGDAKKGASDTLDQIKKLVADFMASDKLEGWKEKLEPLVKKLKDTLKI